MNTPTDPYHCKTARFALDGEDLFVEVVDSGWTVQRCRWPSGETIEQIAAPLGHTGCYIHDIMVSPSSRWVVAHRHSGQGEWGFDVFATSPLERKGGVDEERGYMLQTPQFTEGESAVIGAAGLRYLGGWWAHPDIDIDEPARGGMMTIGFLFVHRLPSQEATRHELVVNVPEGWLADDPWAEWYGPKITLTETGIQLVTSWGKPVEVTYPLPKVIVLPTPHPSGRGVL